jgi:hypothetical protein
MKRSNEKIEWTPEMIAELGQIHDQTIANKYSFPVAVVRARRISLGISPLLGKVWTEEMLDDLRGLSIKDFLGKYQFSYMTVYNKRMSMGMSPEEIKRVSTRRTDWTPEMLADLGAMPDRDFAVKHHISYTTAHSKRKALGILPYGQTRVAWTQEMLDDLGKISLDDYKVKHGVEQVVASEKMKELALATYREQNIEINWTPEILGQLGSMSDRKLANKLNISESSVMAKRGELNIPPFKIKLYAASERKLSLDNKDRNVIRANYQKRLAKKLEMVALSEQGLTRAQIARQMDVTVGLVSRALNTDPDVQEIIKNKEAASPVMTHENILEASIDVLNVPVRIKNTLKMSNINTVGALVGMTKVELLRVPNFNRRSLADLELVLDSFGLTIAPTKYGRPLG